MRYATRFAHRFAARLVLAVAVLALSASAAFAGESPGRTGPPAAAGRSQTLSAAHPTPLALLDLTAAPDASATRSRSAEVEPNPEAALVRRFEMPALVRTVELVPYGTTAPVRRAPPRRKGSGR